eukprot:577762-Rhodomonas_salina.2
MERGLRFVTESATTVTYQLNRVLAKLTWVDNRFVWSSANLQEIKQWAEDAVNSREAGRQAFARAGFHPLPRGAPSPEQEELRRAAEHRRQAAAVAVLAACVRCRLQQQQIHRRAPHKQLAKRPRTEPP